jgi:formiminoglutamase
LRRPKFRKITRKFAEKVSIILQKNAKSIVLGGGHEVTFAHYSGIKKAFPNQKIGIINIDAHFDNREPENGVGASSGTGFWQIARRRNPFFASEFKEILIPQIV